MKWISTALLREAKRVRHCRRFFLPSAVPAYSAEEWWSSSFMLHLQCRENYSPCLLSCVVDSFSTVGFTWTRHATWLCIFLCDSLVFGPTAYIIDTVGLSILPSSTVQSGTPVSIRCRVSISHDNIPNLTHTFQIRRDDAVIYSFTSAEDSVTYEFSPARAADSGNYDCRVTVKDKSKASFSQKLDVTGKAVDGNKNISIISVQ